MFIKTKANRLINLNNIVSISVVKKYNYYSVEALQTVDCYFYLYTGSKEDCEQYLKKVSSYVEAIDLDHPIYG